jgi:predicted acylesterase/phospholipase RssA
MSPSEQIQQNEANKKFRDELFKKERAEAGATGPLIGLALSGGGIRSATFCLGVVQSLAKYKLMTRFDYLSSVSGGGFLASFLHRLRKESDTNRRTLEVLPEQKDKGIAAQAAERLDAELWQGVLSPKESAAIDANPQISHIRRYSNYLVPNKALLSGDTAGSIGAWMRNVFLIQLQLALFLFAAVLTTYVALDGAYWYVTNVQAQHRPIFSGGFALLGLLIFGVSHQRLLAGDYGNPNTAVRWVQASTMLFGSAAIFAALGLIGMAQAANNEIEPLPPVGFYIGLTVALYTAAELLSLPIGLMRYAKSGASRTSLAEQATRPTSLAEQATRPTSLAEQATRPTSLAEQATRPTSLAEQATRPTSLAAQATRRTIGSYVISFGGALAGSSLGGLMLWLSNIALMKFAESTESVFLLGAILGPPAVMLCMLAAACLQLGIMSWAERGAHVLERLRTDVIREYWARVGGRGFMGFVLLWPALSALFLLSPWALAALTQYVAATVAWLASTAAALVLAGGGKTSDVAAGSSKWREYLTVLLPYAFAFGLLALVSVGCVRGLALLADVAYQPSPDFTCYAERLVQLLEKLNTWHVAALVGALGLLWIAMSHLIDINEFGQTKLYQLRIVRAYQAAARAERKEGNARKAEPITNFDPNDDICLAELVQRPYPLINCAMNLVQSDEQNLDWQDRKAANYILSPLFCGFLPGRFNRAIVGDAVAGTSKTAKTLSLGTAVAISGAAANPNMGYHSSPAVAFLLTIFNVRLGWWLANERKQPDLKPKHLGKHLILEMLGQTSDQGHLVNLSDGGHFENLAVYELLRRGVQLIIACDVGADALYQYADLAGLIRKARVDLNTEITLRGNVELPERSAEKPYRSFDVKYPDGNVGQMILIKPCLPDGISLDVEHYARANPHFPQQGTGDQFFDEAQFESYRKLGRHIGERLGADLAAELTLRAATVGGEIGAREALIDAAKAL